MVLNMHSKQQWKESYLAQILLRQLFIVPPEHPKSELSFNSALCPEVGLDVLCAVSLLAILVQ